MLQLTIQNIISQLTSVIELLNDEEYQKTSHRLNQSTIGQHVRHIIELFKGLENGYESGIVNYENRKRDKEIEIKKDIAISLLNNINVSMDKSDKDLLFETYMDNNTNTFLHLKTTYQRELVYNIHHAFHHMALIRVAVKEVSDLQLPENFGMAFSTIKYNNTCAQ